jgi:thioredoxin-disulfide reductase
MYDCIIIGAGPAGMTAGIYSARREMKTLIIGEIIGGQVTWASDIGNYPGFININAFDLILKMKEHVESLGVEIKGFEVKKIEKGTDDFFTVYTEKEVFKAKAVIISIGLKPRRLEIPGEVEFRGKGVTYCASCDAPFYRGKNVAVVGGGNSALDAAEILSKIAKHVYLVHRRDQFKGFEALEQEVKSRENIELILNSQIKNIIGKEKVEMIAVENSINGLIREIEVDGVFIEIGRMAHTDLVADFVSRTEQGQIIVDEKCRTLTPGMFAAGDTTNVPFKQITIAMGQATIAALSAYEYLQLKQGNEIKVIFDRGKH